MAYIGNSVVGVEHPSTSALNATTGAFTGNVTTTGTVEPAGDTAAGDDAAIGYTSAEGLILTGQGSTSDITLKNDADATVFTVPTGTDDILFPDSAKAMFGAGSDLQIYHDGSNSYISDQGTNDLKVLATDFQLKNAADNEFMITAVTDGAVTVYHNNAAKIATTSGGVSVTGSMTASTGISSLGVYNNTTGTSANLVVDSAGGFARSTSSRRYKNTISDATHGLTELLALRPVTYKGNNNGDLVFGGLIAEEVHDAGLTEFVEYNDDNEPDALAYANMVSLCIKAIQEQQATITALTARITALENA